MNTKPRIWHPTKAGWAAYEADELRRTVAELRFQSSGGSYIRAARKGQRISRLLSDAARLDSLAAMYRRQGL